MPGLMDITTQLSALKTDPLRDFKFLVNINHEVQVHPGDSSQPGNQKTVAIGFLLGFTSVGGFSASTNAIPYRSGGMNTTAQMIPGQTSFNPITLQRGLLLGTKQNFKWFQELFSVQVGRGRAPANGGAYFRSDVYVYVLPHPKSDTALLDTVATFHIYNAWPTSISYSDLNSGDNAFIVEQMTLAHEGWDLEHLSGTQHPFGTSVPAGLS